ncbi:MAG TPA: cell wall anchor protein [Candidatus Paceibacterota bacterium]|nr:cell wall anchor protein [Verrucomicrobiota bacterium]HSA11041.1 cell wall anchor protein [Candidatus Paceibacterota bacterium]
MKNRACHLGGLALGALLTLRLTPTITLADTVNAVWNSTTDVPVTADGYAATGNTVSFTLNFAPETGTDLMVVNNRGLPFISGTFDNLAQGQTVVLSYDGVTYGFVADYYGGNGNDLMLVWANTRPFAWGQNISGQLGDNTTTFRPVPAPVMATGVLAGKTVVAIAAGGAAPSAGHSLALCSDGTVAAWGHNYYGQLGDNQVSGSQSMVPVAVNTAPGSALSGKRVVAIGAGYRHSVALCSDGSVATWGWNNAGQLGDNSTNTALVPVEVNTDSGVSALHGKTVVRIAAGSHHNLALCSDGTVAAWGIDGSGQLGDNQEHGYPRLAPVGVNTESGVSALYGKWVVAIAAGASHSLALCSDGTMAGWGADASGQLGDNTFTANRYAPVAVNTNAGLSALFGKTPVAIAVGQDHSLALCSDGTVTAWGNNNYDQLGDNTTTPRSVPVAVNTNSGVSALYGKTVVAIVAGGLHNLALCSDGTTASWGHNAYGQLGDNSTTWRKVPVAVSTAPLPASQRLTHVFSGSYANHSSALVAAPPASPIILTGTQTLTNRSFRFCFTNTPGAFFGVVTATDPGAPLNDWASVTGLTEVTSGQFQFTDSGATNGGRRFYRVRSP